MSGPTPLAEDLNNDVEALAIAQKLAHLQDLRETIAVPSSDMVDAVNSVNEAQRQKAEAMLEHCTGQPPTGLETKLQHLLDTCLGEWRAFGDKVAAKEKNWHRLMVQKEEEIALVKKRETLQVKKLRSKIHALTDQAKVKDKEVAGYKEEQMRLQYYLNRDTLTTLGQPLVMFPRRRNSKLVEGPDTEEPQSLSGAEADMAIYAEAVNAQQKLKNRVPASGVDVNLAARSSLMSKKLDFLEKRILALKMEKVENQQESERHRDLMHQLEEQVNKMRAAEGTASVNLAKITLLVKTNFEIVRQELTTTRQFVIKVFRSLMKLMNERLTWMKNEMMTLLAETEKRTDTNVQLGPKTLPNGAQATVGTSDMSQLAYEVGSLREGVNDLLAAAGLPLLPVEYQEPEDPLDFTSKTGGTLLTGDHSGARRMTIALKVLSSRILPAVGKWINTTRWKLRRLEERNRSNWLDRQMTQEQADKGKQEIEELEGEQEKLRGEIHDMRMRLFVNKMRTRKSSDPGPTSRQELPEFIDWVVRQLHHAILSEAELTECIRIMRQLYQVAVNTKREKWEKILKKTNVVTSEDKKKKPAMPRTTRSYALFLKSNAEVKTQEGGRTAEPGSAYCYRCGGGPFSSLSQCPTCFTRLYYGMQRIAKRVADAADAKREESSHRIWRTLSRRGPALTAGGVDPGKWPAQDEVGASISNLIPSLMQSSSETVVPHSQSSGELASPQAPDEGSATVESPSNPPSAATTGAPTHDAGSLWSSTFKVIPSSRHAASAPLRSADGAAPRPKLEISTGAAAPDSTLPSSAHAARPPLTPSSKGKLVAPRQVPQDTNAFTLPAVGEQLAHTQRPAT